MKRKMILVLLAISSGLALICAAGLISEVQASTVNANSGMSYQPGAEDSVNTFTGKIVSQNGDRFILRDEANDVWYHLDDQQQAGKYFGKNVAVKGILDGRTDTIRVQNITEDKTSNSQ